LESNLGSAFVPENHFVALSTNSKLVTEFGISPDKTFGFWDWVGGRFSMESAIGLSTMIAIGPDSFDEMLQGFHKMDTYFESTPIESNVVVTMALLTLWYRNFFDAQSHAVLPYENYLKRFPAYLQQLLMESNGKSVTIDGRKIDYQTSPVYWGEPGTNGQHSFHQMLHQGTSLVPVDFIFGAKPVSEISNHHTLLLANVLAQSSVLAFGKSADEIAAEGTDANLVPHKVMPGNRPSTMIIYPRLTPSILGQLVALYEHLTLVQGLLWNVGSFDQWGVELGKTVANSITPALENGDTNSLDIATARLVKKIRSY
jgi:glucose-6-phosphate isomerase